MDVSVNLNNIDPSKLIFQGDATIIDQHIRLTDPDNHGNPLGYKVGRVLLSDIVHRYSNTGFPAGFETTFVFRIKKPHNTECIADGLAFFLANADTEIPPGSDGMFLGIFNNNPSNDDRVVAVEFDTYRNCCIGDPEDYRYHIGIDIHSIRSSKVCKWNFHDAAETLAKITYDSALKKLTVHVSTIPDSQSDTLTYDVDLSTKLPEKFRVGLSASTGAFSQTTEILFWSFNSK